MYIDPPFSPPPCQRAGISAQILGRSTDAKKKYLKWNSVEYFTFISVIFYSKSARKTLLKRSTYSKRAYFTVVQFRVYYRLAPTK